MYQQLTNKLVPYDYLLDKDQITSYWNEKRKIGINSNTGRNIKDFTYYTLDKQRIPSILDLEEHVYSKYGKYRFGSININSILGYKHHPDFYKDLLNKFYNNSQHNGYSDYVLGYGWSIEKGIKNKKWHVHMYFFIREDCDSDKILIYIKMYLESIVVSMTGHRECRVWCNMDKVSIRYSEKRNVYGAKRKKYRKENRKDIDESLDREEKVNRGECRLDRIDCVYLRNIVRIRLLYLCKVKNKEGRDRNKSRDYLRHRDVYRDIGYKEKLFGIVKNKKELCSIDRIRLLPDPLQVSRGRYDEEIDKVRIGVYKVGMCYYKCIGMEKRDVRLVPDSLFYRHFLE